MSNKELLDLKKSKIKPLLEEIEKVLDGKKLKGEHRKDEFQKIFSCLIQDFDIVNTYERRKFGVTDKNWDNALLSLSEALGKNNENK